MSTKNPTLSAKDMVEIIRAFEKTSIYELKYGNLHIKSGNNLTEIQDKEENSTNIVLKQNKLQYVEEVPELSDELPSELSEEEKEDQLNHLMVLDPLEYEEAIMQGDNANA